MTPDIEKIEHLLNAKTFEELTAPERELVLAHLSGAAEYEHMRDTLVRVKKVFVAEAAALQSDADLKEQILLRFEQNRPKAVSLSDKIATFFTTLIPSPAGRFAGALGLVVIGVTVGFFMWPKQPDTNQQAQELFPRATQPQIITLPDTSAPITLKTLEVYDEWASTPAPAMYYNATATEDLGVTSASGSAVPEAILSSAPMEEREVRGQEKAASYQWTTADDKKVERVGLGENNETKGLLAPPTNNNVYYNSDGYKVYSNARVAQLPPGKTRQLFDTVNPSFKKSETKDLAVKEESANQKPYKYVQQTQVAQDSVRLATTLTQVPGVTNGVEKADVAGTGSDMQIMTKTSGSVDQTVNSVTLRAGRATYATTTSKAPKPAWPGTENRADALTLTQESVKAFFDKERNESYRTLSETQKQSAAYSETQFVRITLTFNEKGVITKVHVSGTTDERQKRAFIQRALQLPTFKFTTGEGKPVLEQTYVIPVRS